MILPKIRNEISAALVAPAFRSKMKHSKKILVVMPSWLGDAVMAQVLLKILKFNNEQQKISVQIDVLAVAWVAKILARMPEISEIIENPFEHGNFKFFERKKFAKNIIKTKSYDEVYVLPNSWKSALIPYFAEIPKRFGFVGELRYGLLNFREKLNKKRFPLMIERFARLAFLENPENNFADLTAFFPKLTIDKNNTTKLLNLLGIKSQESEIIVFCPGAEYGKAKRWLPEHFAELSNLLSNYYYKNNTPKVLKIVILGSNKDNTIGEKIVALANNANLLNLCGKTDLTDVIDLLANAEIIISNDSGLMHVAAAVGVPQIAIYGSSSPNFTPPLSANNLAEIVTLKLPCSPCFQRNCPKNKHSSEYLQCLKDITPQMIFEKILQKITKKINKKINKK